MLPRSPKPAPPLPPASLHRLFWRILLGFWLAMLGVSLFALGLLWIFQTTWVERFNKISFSKPSVFMVDNGVRSLRAGGAERFREFARLWPEQRFEPPYVVGLESGSELLGRELRADTLASAQGMAAELPESPVQRVTTPSGERYLVFYPEGRGPVDQRFVRLLLDWPWLLALILAGGSLGFSFLLARTLSWPIQLLKGAFDAMAHGQLDIRLGDQIGRRRDELGELARHFDAMASRLAQLIGTQRQLLHDVSHELRSPLARLGVAIALARQRPDRTPEALERIEKESQRLDRLIGEVLALARLESGTAPPREDYVDLVELLRVVAEDAAFEAEANGQTIVFAAGEADEILLRGNAELLRRAFDNVLRNAIQHASGTPQVEMTLSRPGGGAVVVTIADRGPGAEPEQLESFFKPFAHGPYSKGFGLGLAIARRAVEVHGGQISARARAGGGLEVEIALPTPPKAEGPGRPTTATAGT